MSEDPYLAAIDRVERSVSELYDAVEMVGRLYRAGR
jgi:hypothetical protein